MDLVNPFDNLLPSTPENHTIMKDVTRLRPDQMCTFMAFFGSEQRRKYVYLGDAMDILHPGSEPLSEDERRTKHTAVLRACQRFFLPEIGAGGHRLHPKKKMLGQYVVECLDGTRVSLIKPLQTFYKVSGVVKVPHFLRYVIFFFFFGSCDFY